jgi:hypothetical protein
VRIVCAGGTRMEYTNLCVKHRAAKLYSVLNDKSHIRRWQSDELFLMIDSGAHSWNKFTITKIGHSSSGDNLPPIKDHAEWYLQLIYQFRHRPWIFVELDCYGNLDKSYIDQMYHRVKAIKGNFEFIRVYHPTIDNGSCSELRKWIDEGQTYIGIGNDSIPILDRIFSLTGTSVKVHGFAMTKESLLLQYPFYSVDSTSPLACEMYGSKTQGVKQVPKERLVKNRDPALVRDRFLRLEDAVREIKKTELFLTRYWLQRGVNWNDRYERVLTTTDKSTEPRALEL